MNQSHGIGPSLGQRVPCQINRRFCIAGTDDAERPRAADGSVSSKNQFREVDATRSCISAIIDQSSPAVHAVARQSEGITVIHPPVHVQRRAVKHLNHPGTAVRDVEGAQNAAGRSGFAAHLQQAFPHRQITAEGISVIAQSQNTAAGFCQAVYSGNHARMRKGITFCNGYSQISVQQRCPGDIAPHAKRRSSNNSNPSAIFNSRQIRTNIQRAVNQLNSPGPIGHIRAQRQFPAASLG